MLTHPRSRRFHRQGAVPRSVLVLICGTCLAPGTTMGQTRAAAMDAHLSERTSSGYFSGAVLVSAHRRVLLREGYGSADLEQGAANGPETIFRIGSITKPITAAAVLVLVDRGRLSLDDGVCSFVADCPGEWAEVTVRHLLTHTSGIPDLFTSVDDAPVGETRDAIDRTIAAAREPDRPAARLLARRPGQEYSYSNFGYMLLGYIIEVVSGRPWEDFLRETVFQPAGMVHTAYDDVWQIVPGRARGYRVRRGSVTNTPYDDHSAYAAGGLRSTVDDLARFHEAFAKGRLFSKDLVQLALTPFLGLYGFGWQIRESFGRPYYNHNGSITGFSSQISYYPGDGLLIVVMANLVNDENARTLACDLAAIYFEDDEHVLVDPTRRVTVDPALFPRYAGEYDTGVPPLRTIIADETGLSYQRGDDDPIGARAVDDSTFYLRPDITIRFTSNEAGVYDQFTVKRCGSEQLRGTRRRGGSS